MHLTDAELRDFANGALAASDLLRADDHLAACAQCQRRAFEITGATELVRALGSNLNAGSIHLLEEELQLATIGRLSGKAHEEAARHLKNCSICAREVEELRAWADTARGPRVQTNWLRFAAAVIIALLIPAAIWLVLSGHQPRTESLAGMEQLPLPMRERVQRALQTGSASLPEFLAEMGSFREVQMGSQPGNRVALLLEEPVATGVASDRPEFRWGAVAGANAYVVSIFDQQFRLIARSPALTEPSWSPTAPLPRGQTYVWQVTAYRGKQTVTAPAPPDPPAAFHIIDADSAVVLRRAEAQHPDSHLLLGILYAEAGIRNAAITHLRLVPPRDPHEDVARRTSKLFSTPEHK